VGRFSLEAVMVTWMEHPQHGKHPAIAHEVEAMQANGWTKCAPKVKEAPEPAQEVAEEAAPVVDAPVRRKPGRKPKA
jgi:hypothetical protein